MRRRLSTSLIVSAMVVLLFSLSQGEAQQTQFPTESRRVVEEALSQQLVREGFEPAFVETLLQDQRWELSLLVLERNLIFRESTADYDRFLSDRSTALARAFLEQNRAFLEKTEGAYGVEKEIIVAILLIESAFGRYAEKYGVFNALSTLSQANHPEVLRLTFDHLKASYPDLTEAYLRKRAQRKSKWAFQELKALIEIGIREDLDILGVRGSWAGAFGLPQFIPTSYLTYGADGDGDNRIQLQDRHDAMASVANYLQAHGWKPGLAKAQRMKVLFRYNRSRLYGETVLKCAEKLKEGWVAS